MAAIPSNRCPNCLPISEPEQMRSAPADASSAIPITRALGDRAIEHDLLPWCAQHAAPVMAYWERVVRCVILRSRVRVQQWLFAEQSPQTRL